MRINNVRGILYQNCEIYVPFLKGSDSMTGPLNYDHNTMYSENALNLRKILFTPI